MKVVVIGASGNIGSAVVRELASDGEHEVLGVARRRPAVARESAHASVSWRSADVSVDDLDDVVAGADVVVHLAWMFQPTHRQDVTWATNAVGTRRVLDAVRRQGVGTVICASSVAAYSPVDHDDPVDEGWSTDGTSEATYCREKAYVERTLDAFEATDGIRVVRLRPAFVFQRSAASEQRRVFGGPLARPAFLNPRYVPLVPVPTGLRFQAVHAGDVARAVAAAVARPVSGAFNVAGDGVLRRSDLGAVLEARTVEVPPGLARTALAAAWRAHVATVPGSLFGALMRMPIMSTDRARSELGWTPRHSGAEALRAMLLGAGQRAGSDLPPLRP